MTIVVALWGVAALLGIAVLGIPAQRIAAGSRLIYLGCLLACLTILVAACGSLLTVGSAAERLTLPIGLPWIGAHFSIDALSAFFLCVINLGGAAASLYALGYGEHEETPGRVLPFYPAFLAGMNAVILAADAFSFLFAWEFMSLSSWALVMVYHQDADNRRAGYIYIVMASFGTLALLLAFGLLAGPTGSYAFAEMRDAQAAVWLPGLVLGLALLGAGSKAGLVPLHVWLPLAHPAAPSHVSALMSGVMTKVAVYGFIRIVFDLLGAPVWWWGSVVLVLGSATAVLGVLYAVLQRDLKRLLAYSTVENVGIIFIGLGLALAFKANGMAGAAALAFTAALFHVLNHSFFKSLLFFGAGAVLTSTGARDIEKLGGLISARTGRGSCSSSRSTSASRSRRSPSQKGCCWPSGKGSTSISPASRRRAQDTTPHRWRRRRDPHHSRAARVRPPRHCRCPRPPRAPNGRRRCRHIVSSPRRSPGFCRLAALSPDQAGRIRMEIGERNADRRRMPRVDVGEKELRVAVRRADGDVQPASFAVWGRGHGDFIRAQPRPLARRRHDRGADSDSSLEWNRLHLDLKLARAVLLGEPRDELVVPRRA